MSLGGLVAHFEKLTVPMMVADTEGRMIEANSVFCEYLGYTRAEILEMNVADFTHPDDYQRTRQRFEQVRQRKFDHFSYQKKYLRKDGQTVWAIATTSWIREEGSPKGLCVAVIQDITIEIRSQEKLHESEELHRTLLDNIELGIALIDENNKILKTNRAMVEMFGKHSAGFKENDCFRELENRGNLCGHCPGLLCLQDGQPHTVETEVVRDDGSRFMGRFHAVPVFDSDGKARKFIEVVEDITERQSLKERLRKNQDELNYLAHHDQLTGLPNRTLLYDRLSHAIVRAKRSKEGVAVLLFDIDRFSKINQSLGFSVGNQVLKEVSIRLKNHLRKADSLCRISGTDFAMVLETPGTPQRAAKVARNVLGALNKKAVIAGGHEIHVTVSVGISQFPNDGEESEDLLRAAEKARRQARERGGDAYQFFELETEKDSKELLLLENQLRTALVTDQVIPYFQPQVDVTTGEVIGLEALARWEHPERGFMSPGEFIPLAEESGLIVALGNTIMEKACLQGKRWQDEGLLRFRISVNVSAIQIAKGHLVQTVKDILRKTGLPSVFLEVEITESALMNEPERALKALTKLRDLGVSIALDDFGTGYSALSYLKVFPFDRLKIDQGFIRNIPYSDQDTTIVEAILAMSKKLGVEVIAEGVETAEHLRRLLELGCSRVQGYYYSRPLDADTMTEGLEKWLGSDGLCPLEG